jgi:hypothetical protein
VQGFFESIEETSSKDGVIWTEHANNVKGDVFCVGVLWGSNGYDPNWFDSFPVKVIEGLRRFYELFSVITHFLKG